MFFFKRNGKVHPMETNPRDKGPVETKGKELFKNLRMRLKLVHNKLDTPITVEQNIQKRSRLQRFLNFFKFRGLKRRRLRKIGPLLTDGGEKRFLLQTNLDVGVTVVAFDAEKDSVQSSNTDGKEDKKEELLDQEVSQSDVEEDLISEDGSIYLADEDSDQSTGSSITNDNEVLSVADWDATKQKVEATSSIQNEKVSAVEQKDLFERIEKKIASSTPKNRKLAPIIGGAKPKLQQLNVEYSLFDNKFYRGDLLISQQQQQLTLRPATPRLCKDPLEDRELLSEEALEVKQNKADELRNETVMKRLQLISVRRDRFEKRKAELVEKKKTMIQSKNEREEKIAENKTKIDTEKVEKIRKYSEEWKKRYEEQLIIFEQKKHERELKVERKKASTDLVCLRRDALLNSHVKKLQEKHTDIAFRLELNRMDSPRPSTAPSGVRAFSSRQPKNEDDPLC